MCSWHAHGHGMMARRGEFKYKCL